jgi:hypothetical protein
VEATRDSRERIPVCIAIPAQLLLVLDAATVAKHILYAAIPAGFMRIDKIEGYRRWRQH